MKNPDQYIEKHNIQVLLYSPSITVGLDIKKFEHVYCFFQTQSINEHDMFQMLFRNRTVQKINIFYPKKREIPSDYGPYDNDDKEEILEEINQ